MVQPNFGIRIRQLRLAKGLSQRDLADQVGLSEDQISNIERGRSWVGEPTFVLLAEALDVVKLSLLDYTGNDAFITDGGLKARAQRKRSKLIVRNKRNVQVTISKKRKL
jgi:transcriptional regulator with XRE-family HTH domain